MNEDRWMKELSQILEDEPRLDPRLEAHANRELSFGEIQDLKADAERDPELAAAIALHDPLSKGVQSKLRTVIRRAGRWRRRAKHLWKGGALLPIAAALLLYLRASPAVLPKYALETWAGDSVFRDSSPGVRTLPSMREDSTLQVILRPSDPVQGDLVARLESVQDGQPCAHHLEAEVSAEGVVRWRDRAGSFCPGFYGRVSLKATVALAGHLPDEGSDQRGWQTHVFDVWIRPQADDRSP